jgi:hypothetical protein
MTTLLNSAKNTDDAASILHNIIPKLLPSLRGALFLYKDAMWKV